MSSQVSIIMNCRNGEKYLRESLKSVLEQTYKNWELIFVDNESTDNSKKIFSEFKDERMKYIFIDKSVNLGSARQIALENCNGEYISFLDTDDLWFPKKLEEQIPYFKDLKVGMVITNTIFFSKHKEKNFYKKNPPTGYVFYNLLKNYYISLETLVCRKKFLEQISFKFDKDYSMISDLDLTLRLSMVSKLAFCPLILAKWRVHKSSDSWNKKELFFSEKLKLIDRLSNIQQNISDINFLKLKKIFIRKINFSIILNLIEIGRERNKLLKQLFKNFSLDYKFFLILILIFIPFNKNLIKLYKNNYTIEP